MASPLTIHTLGGLSITLDGQPVTGFDSRKVAAILVYLACTGRTYPREVLAEFFWEGRAQAQALSNLRVALTSLRQQVGPYLDITRETVGLSDDPAWSLDVAEFERLLSAAEPDQLQAALGLYQGDFLDGFYVDSDSFEAWTRLERERLRFSVMDVLDRLITLCRDQGNFNEGIAHATRLLQMDPFREETHRQLMRLLSLSGQRAAALEQYERCRDLLNQELGVAPSAETTALLDLIRSGAEIAEPLPARPIAAESAIPVENPYKGLRAFQEADAPDFFGREALTGRLLERLAEEGPYARFLAVVGPSGSGKSSAVKAGLIPALRQGALPNSEAWQIVQVVPGTHPLEELEIALARLAGNPSLPLLDQLRRDTRGILRAARLALPEDGPDLLLVIDQFEELFTLVDEPTQAKFVLDSLYAAVNEPRTPLRVVITLRADFYDRPLMYPDFAEMVRQRTEAITPMTTEELARAVSGPAERVGVQLEEGLTTTIVTEVTEQPGMLPMLQYALTEMFDRRQDHTLTREAYHAIGGALGALAHRTDAVFETLTPDQQAAARQVCLRLVTLGEGTEDIRRRALQEELEAAGGAEITAVLPAFDRSRLLTFDQDPTTGKPTVELAHEAIIREWGRLRGWLEESRDDIRLQRLLNRAAGEWTDAQTDASYLLRGSRLAQFQEWAKHTRIALTHTEQEYLAASVAEERRRRARQRFVRNIALIAALVIALIMGGLALLAQDARLQAERNAARSRDLALVNGAQAALAQGDTDTALALAVAANQTNEPSTQAQLVLSQAAYLPGTIRLFEDHHAYQFVSLHISPDGRMAVSGGFDGTFKLWDLASGRVVYTAMNREPPLWVAVALSPDSRSILTITIPDLELWDTETGDLIRPFDNSLITSYCMTVPVFSPDGSLVAGSNGGGSLDYSRCENGSQAELLLWDTATGEVIRTIQGYEYGIMVNAFSPDGQTILSVMKNGVLVMADIASGTIIDRIGESQELSATGWMPGLAISPDGKTALVASTNGGMVLWDLETHQTIRRFETGPAFLAAYVDLSQDGTTALVSGTEGATLWDVQTGARLAFIPGKVFNVALSPDGRTALLGYGDGSLRQVDLFHGTQVRRFTEPAYLPDNSFLALSPDGSTFQICAKDTWPESPELPCRVALVDVATGAEIRRIGPGDMALEWFAFSPDGHRAVMASHILGSYMDATSDPDSFSVSVWDLETGRQINRLQVQEPKDSYHWVEFSPDGQTIALGGGSVLGLWDAATGQEIRSFVGHTSMINGLAFSPDGALLATASQDNPIVLWDVATGQELYVGDQGAPANRVAFSPDGTILLSTGDNGQVVKWEVATGRELGRFFGHARATAGVHFSPDGR